MSTETINVKMETSFFAYPKDTHYCQAAFYVAEEGGYYVIAQNLPGVASEGDTLDEAIENIEDAFRSVIATYVEEGMPVPFVVPTSDEQPSFVMKLTVR